MVELQLSATIFGFTSFFNGSTGHSSFENSWQRVENGDANGVPDSEKTVVLALEQGQVLGGIEPGSKLITPNGDGINDSLELEFCLCGCAPKRHCWPKSTT